jgi:hypothetical protein
MNPSVASLIDDFVDAAKMHYAFTMIGDYTNVNVQAKRMDQVFHKIIQIGKEAREALLAQVDNEEPAISLAAATFSLKYDSERAKRALEQIANRPGLIGFGAKQALRRWEEGTWNLE